MGFGQYILDENNQPIPCEDILKWGRWFQQNDKLRIVAQDETPNGRVSTVFLGLDHRLLRLQGEESPPILWETMVFGGPLDGEQIRYCSFEAAKAGHVEMLERVKNGQVERA